MCSGITMRKKALTGVCLALITALAWVAAPAIPHSAITGTPSQNSGPSGAAPKMRKPAAPQPRPKNSARRSPNRSTIGPIAAPCTAMAQLPTMASVRPTVLMSQP